MKKYKTYYTGVEVMEYCQISERTLRYRLATLKKKYMGQSSLLSKQNNIWRIHNSILEHFEPKRKSLD
ncbi:hypothetical protein [Leeuwenhoekiella marinoflava]|uniref:HTH domain-containing protein n=2 Tax=Leeuwenhoekiella marinoflava TaxID=988 RepID=A0A4Q0PNR4_9FLAO|nr:hypothetical protein [Leeuwenhoekiella marinoflava]RXG30656.1 hypothetical protein DSL99_1698 [Leeuwenhoekiella marinoflava]SHF20588.1 hypothetical protein SAMN02745246_01959 [Leeuwenhoekiella marinoflava DSM 3653]